MKRFFAIFLLAAMVLATAGCTQTPEEPPKAMDQSGKYYLHEGRNEAIINDAGVIDVTATGIFFIILSYLPPESTSEGIPLIYPLKTTPL